MIDNEGRQWLPAAAIPEWAEVLIPGRSEPFVITRILNSTPQPGDITWIDEALIEATVGGAQKIQILRMDSLRD